MNIEENEAKKLAYKKMLEKSKNDNGKTLSIRTATDINNLQKESFNLINSDISVTNTKYHSQYDFDDIKSIKNKNAFNIKEKFYHCFFGDIEYVGYKNPNLINHSSLSMNIYNEKIMKKISPISENIDIIENFNFRLFKYLDSYKDLYMTIYNEKDNSSLKDDTRAVYVTHLLNHLSKRKQEIERNNKISNIIFKEANMTNKIKEELFIDKDLNELKNEEQRLKEEQKKIMSENLDKKLYSLYTHEPLENIINEEIQDLTLEQLRKHQNKLAEHIKDSGFTSPKILILCPYKKHAVEIINEIVNQLNNGVWKGISKKKKFKEEFSDEEAMTDFFRMGISYNFETKKLSFYSSFEDSDIIIASPLGLKFISKNDENIEENEKIKQKQCYDFLSSIEILLIDNLNFFLYQNMTHLEEILYHLNVFPKKSSSLVNIHRIGDIFKDNNGKYIRQNIFISDFRNLEIECFVKTYCTNYRGMYLMHQKHKNLFLSEEYSSFNLKLEFKFLKIDASMDAKKISEFKFNYFTKNLWQLIYDSFEKHSIIFVNSYYEFLQLKHFFDINSRSVVYLSEYSEKPDWQRNRNSFEKGKFKFLLYTERAHFFRKINLRFAKNIFFYSLPEDPCIFKELLELVDSRNYKEKIEHYKIEDNSKIADTYSAIISLYTIYEKYNIQRILGNDLAGHLIKKKIENYVI